MKHIYKSADVVALDLKGASKEQAGAIKDFVGALPKAQQAKVHYVNP